MEHIIPQHREPLQLLPDRGATFLSKIMLELYKLLGIKKVSMTAYHPQTDSLVERYIHTLIDMLSKKVEQSGKDWDKQLPYVFLHTVQVLKNLPKLVVSFCCMGVTPSSPQQLL